jgi:hypothetical protein
MAGSTATLDNRSPGTPWFPFLAGPVVGALHEAIGYLMVSRSCATGFPGFSFGPLSGVGVEMLILTVVAEAILIAAIVSGIRAWRQDDDEVDGDGGRAAVSRVRFMGLVGALLSAGFALYVLYAGLAGMLLNPCVFL